MGYCSASLRSGQRTSIGSAAVATRSRASTTFSRSPALIRPTASATWPIHCSPFIAPSVKLTSTGARGDGGQLEPPVQLVEAADGGDGGEPRRVATTAEDHLGDDERRVARLVGERERPERDQAAARLVDVAADDRPGGELAPPGVRLLEPARTAGPDLGRDAAADQAVAVPQPGDRVVLGEHVEQASASAGSSSSTVRTTRGAVGVSVETSVSGPLVTRVERTHASARRPTPGPAAWVTSRPSSSRRRPRRRPGPGRRATPPRRSRGR